MKINILSIGLICLTLTNPAEASDYLMYIGAGGEAPKKESTIFDQTIQNMAKYVKRSPALKVNVALDGGHPKTEALIQETFQNAESKSKFLVSDYQRLIQSYKLKLENNEMVAGDQLMIFIDSHGAEKLPQYKSHTVATSGGNISNFDTLAGGETVNLDELEVLKNLAKTKGVKMAIVDASCHSGNTLALADDNTCVISSTGPNHYAYTSFAQNFSAQMVRGKNLEEIFLQIRKEDTTPELPMISTAAGQEVTTQLYEQITPFLYHLDPENDKLTPYLKKTQNEGPQCLANYHSLIDTINAVEELNAISSKVPRRKRKKNKLDLSQLKKLLENYQKSMVHIQTEMLALDTNRLNQKERISTPSLSVEYSWRSLLTTDFKGIVSGLDERIARETLPVDVAQLQGLVSAYNQAIAKKAELIKAHPDLANIIAREQAIQKSITSNHYTVAAIATEERKLYAALYQASQANHKDETPNPCRDFKL